MSNRNTEIINFYIAEYQELEAEKKVADKPATPPVLHLGEGASASSTVHLGDANRESIATRQANIIKLLSAYGVKESEIKGASPKR